MLDLLRVLGVLLAAVAMGLSLAHALEMPGKLRLGREEYLAVQRIYYPGFTIGGIAEPLGIIVTLILLLLTPAGSRNWWLTLAALLGLAGAQAVYWLVTHPVNKVWLRDERLAGAGAVFFAADPARRGERPGEASAAGWTRLRDRWEYSHVARAGLALAGLVALVLTLA